MKESNMYKYTNNLVHESSPYLLQHAHNPVNWYAWGDEALKKARDENKMLVISIGYAACHWCHVMEHESFEDTTVARIMNEHFVSIKVDREERPDIDQLYMNAAYIMTGSGGWPLNVLALPDGKPFYAGTYFTRDNWIKVLQYFIDMQNNDLSGLVTQAENITRGIRSLDNIVVNQGTVQPGKEELDEVFNKLKPYLDFDKGGINRAPKFPIPSTWEYLLHYYSLSNDNDALKAVLSTLDNMAAGGIYDHIGGGFSRYSTDENWHVPHFEKMLYDNAQLISLYTHAWQLTKNPLYRQIVFETIDFIENKMTSPDGAFYSSLDADSEGGEGKFYVWTKKEVEAALGKEAPLLIDYYNITEKGNWGNGQNILYRKFTDSDVLRKFNLDTGELQTRVDKGRETLMKVRSERVWPGLDDKILTSWNALMLKGYVDAYRAFGEERFLRAALVNADFLTENAINQNNEITRNSKSGKSAVPGMLDDYAFTVSAFIDLYQATFDEKWLYKAKELTEYTMGHFTDNPSGMFWYTSNDHSELIARKMEITDNVIPSSNSEMALNLYLLSIFFDNEPYMVRARQMLKNVNDDMMGNISSYANWGRLGIHFVRPLFEVAITGQDCDSIRKTMDRSYLPMQYFLVAGTREHCHCSGTSLCRARQQYMYV